MEVVCAFISEATLRLRLKTDGVKYVTSHRDNMIFTNFRIDF